MKSKKLIAHYYLAKHLPLMRNENENCMHAMAWNTQVLTNENWTTVMGENLIQLDLEVAW